MGKLIRNGVEYGGSAETADRVTFTPNGGIESTNVQDAIDEVIERVATWYYNANTDRTVLSNRVAAIKAAYDALGGKSKVGLCAFTIRYYDGFYYSYFAINPGTSGTSEPACIMELNPHSGEKAFYHYVNGVVSQLSEDHRMASGRLSVTASTSMSLITSLTGLPSGWKLVQAQLWYNSSAPKEVSLTTTQNYAQATAVRSTNMTQQKLSVQFITDATTVYIYGAWEAAGGSQDVQWQWVKL